jgi:hypothetical protein
MEPTKSLNRSILILIAIGIWVIVLQNSGILRSIQKFEEINPLEEQVKANGNVKTDNTVDMNVARINGYRSFYKHKFDEEYDKIPGSTGN